ncbi:molybdopterin synthase [Halorussus salilacus]|uniref:molybdopterin synthase n=1 Tax=Halorussus salilacus TaxID=2953750 RepID=UPI0020A1AB69|nr:molybdopterin synthase [Halorussus salilacus]USZ67192.1 molybdopterin synthase [Halorussus salilacus]
MYVLGVVGPERETRAVADELADHFGADGRVALVERDSTDTDEADGSGADVTYRLSEQGWTASGRDRDLPDLLDDLAPEYDYALLANYPDAAVPAVVVGDPETDPAGETLLEVEDADALDPAEVATKLAATEPHETLESLVAQTKRSEDAPYSGAIATFTGRVRAKEDPDDEPTQFLEFEKYDGVAEERMDAIRAELEEREGVFEVLLHHRTGVVEYGEDIVFVVVLAGHREEAFRTVEDGINRLKDEVPLFKKEVTTDEQFWVHERS